MSSDGPDPGGRRALIIATGQYEDGALRRLRSPAKDAEELTDVLEDPAVGGYDVLQLLDQPDYVVRVQIEGFFADARPDDLLLLYLSCHGVKDQSGQLYFAAVNTRPNRLASTGISAEFVHQQVERCRSRRIVLLLDCCYSGAYARGYRPRAQDDAALGSLESRGWAVITSSTALEYAFEIDSGKVSLKKAARKIAPSLFTSAIVEGLRTGAADLNQDGLISFDELYTYVWTSIRQRTPHQTPEKKWGDVRGDIIIARNPHPAPAQQPGQAGTRDGTLIRISRRQAVLGLAAAAATTGIGVAGWEFMQGGRGTEIWRFTTSTGLTGTPRVVDGVVYAANGDSLYALRATDGGKIWAQPFGGGQDNMVVTSAAIYGSDPGYSIPAWRSSDGSPLWTAHIGSTGTLALTDGLVCAADLIGNVHGLRMQGGTRAWQAHVGGRVTQGPVVAGGTVYVGSGDGRVHALHAGTGAALWHAVTGTGEIESLTVTGGVVYSGSSDGYNYALHAGSGKHLWRLFTSGVTNLVTADDVAYFCGTGFVHAVDISNGKGRWESAAGSGAELSPTISGRTIYVGSYDHDLYAFRAGNGTMLWKFRTGGYVTAAVAADGCVYFGSYDRNLYALRASDGAKIWSFPTYGWIMASPALVNGVVYTASEDGNIYAVRA
jgi:outer membrane protein assembly factor BamB